MTLIAALALDDRVLVAGDGKAITVNRNVVTGLTKCEKVFRHPTALSVAWGFCGAQPVGFRFRGWLESQTLTSWDALMASAQPQLAGMNGDAAGFAELARRGASFEPAQVLVAGYIGGEPGMLYLDDEGGVTPMPSNPFFLGLGESGADTAWDTLTLLLPPPVATEANFRTVLEQTIEHTPNLGPPLSVIKCLP